MTMEQSVVSVEHIMLNDRTKSAYIIWGFITTLINYDLISYDEDMIDNWEADYLQWKLLNVHGVRPKR